MKHQPDMSVDVCKSRSVAASVCGGGDYAPERTVWHPVEAPLRRDDRILFMIIAIDTLHQFLSDCDPKDTFSCDKPKLLPWR